MLAAEQGSLEVLQELIRRGANVNLDDVVRQAPLTHHHSPLLICFHGHKVSCCVCVCQDCWSALISATKEGHVDVVKELLENSAYIEHRDMVRHTHTHTHTGHSPVCSSREAGPL